MWRHGRLWWPFRNLAQKIDVILPAMIDSFSLNLFKWLMVTLTACQCTSEFVGACMACGLRKVPTWKTFVLADTDVWHIKSSINDESQKHCNCSWEWHLVSPTGSKTGSSRYSPITISAVLSDTTKQQTVLTDRRLQKHFFAFPVDQHISLLFPVQPL